MTTQVQKRRGTTTEHSTFTGAEGEITVDTTKDTAVVHDGVSAGGKPLAREDLNNVSASTVAAKLNGTALTGVDINSGAIDSTTIGATTPAAGTFTALTATGTTTLAGATTSADINFGDNDKAIFGAGSDLQIYHSGGNSYINDLGTGGLKLTSDGTGIDMLTSNLQEYLARFNTNGNVTIYYDGSPKLATTSTGIDVTGTATMDGLSLGDQHEILLGGVANYRGEISFDPNGNTSLTIANSWDNDNSEINFKAKSYTAAKNTMTIKGSGDISFYEDTGTTAKFFWDASAESLELGTSSGMTPTASLAINEVVGGTPAIEIIPTTDATSGTTAAIRLWGTAYGTANRNSEIRNVTNGGTNANELTFATNGSERMRIDSSGNVGIGTASPTADLSVGSTTSTSGDVHLRTSKTAFEITPSNSDAGGVNLGVGWVTGGQGPMKFSIGATERMRIDSSGNVGIGTSSPSTELTIGSGGGGNDLGVLLSRGATTNFYEAYDGTKGFIAGVDNTQSFAKVGTLTSHPVAFVTGNGERMRIDSSGNLLVGKTSTGYETQGASIRSSGRLFVTSDGEGTALLNRLTSDGDILTFAKDTATVGSIGGYNGDLTIGTGDTGIVFDDANDTLNPVSATAGNARDGALVLGGPFSRFKDLYLSGGVITSSDYRLKNDIQPMESSADKIKALNLVNFAWNESGEREDGFIAHELQEVIPSAVRGEKDAVNEEGDAQYQGVDSLKLIPVLTKALQEALVRIDELEAKLP